MPKYFLSAGVGSALSLLSRPHDRLVGFLAAVVLLASLALGNAAFAQSPARSVIAELSSAGQARVLDPQAVDASLADRGHVAVIVEFAAPEIPAGVQSDSAEGDRVLTDAIRQQQDRILTRAMQQTGQPDTIEPGAIDSEVVAEMPGVTRMRFSPMFAVFADAQMLRALAEDPDVVRIHINGISDPDLTQTLPLIGMPAAYAAGGTGQGQVVAVLDTGARLSHEHLSARIVEGACYNTIAGDIPGFTPPSSSLCPGGASSSTTLQSGDDCTNPAWSGCGHGTHVSSTAAGFVANPGQGVPPHGVARNARIMSINVFSLFPASQCGPMLPEYTHCVRTWDSDQIRALERVYERRNARNFAAVNMSLGGGQYFSACQNNPLRPIVQQLTNAGIAVISSAGNDGYDNAVGAPACIPEVIAIANTTNADQRQLNPSTGRGSNWGSLVDIAAPGTSVRAAYVSGNSNTHYAALTGTSMAAPHVAGAFAAIRTVHPDATVAQIRDALIATGTGVTAAGRTIPRINVDAAIARLSGATSSVSTTTTVTGPSTSTPGESVSFTARVTAGSGSGTPTGTVSFRRNGIQFATRTLNTNGRAIASISTLPSGSSQITAVYLGASGFQGSTSSALTHTVSGSPSAPPNNLFEDRITIASPGTVTGTNTNATSEPGQPSIAVSNSTNAVWWRFVAGNSGTLTIDTFGSNFDTTLAIFTGGSVSNLTEVAANDDAGGTRQSRVSFQAVQGRAYQIAVAGYSNASGNITLNVALQPPSQVSTTTTLSGPSIALLGQAAIFNARVTSSSGTPNGRVSLRRNGVEIASENLNSNGVANFQIANLPVGSSNIRAHYLGATGFTASQSATLATSVLAEAVGFVGGGVLFSQTDECASNLGMLPHAVTVRYGPSELNGPPSGVSIVWREGSEHLSLWGPMAPSASFLGGAGRQSWTRFVFYPTRPLIRIVERRVTRPSGASLADASELVLRMRVRNFSAEPGCAATITATLRRE